MRSPRPITRAYIDQLFQEAFLAAWSRMTARQRLDALRGLRELPKGVTINFSEASDA
jgi:hypothetical protein